MSASSSQASTGIGALGGDSNGIVMGSTSSPSSLPTIIGIVVSVALLGLIGWYAVKGGK